MKVHSSRLHIFYLISTNMYIYLYDPVDLVDPVDPVDPVDLLLIRLLLIRFALKTRITKRDKCLKTV